MKAITSVVLAIFVAYAAGSQHLYKMDFEENGSKFEENIIINKEKGYLIYDVPQHNDIQAARFLKDFKARLNVLLDALQKVCYISDMKSDEPTPDSVEDGLKMVQGHFPNGQFMVQNEQIFPGPKIEDDKLPAIVKKFCQGMKKLSIVHKSSKQVEESLKEKLLETYNKRSKRHADHIISMEEFQFCDTASAMTQIQNVQSCYACNRPDLVKLNCDVNWTKYCGYIVSRGMWSVDCAKHSSRASYTCTLPTHTRATVKCCRTSCPLNSACKMV